MKPLIVSAELLNAMVSRKKQIWIRVGVGAGVGITFAPVHGWAAISTWFAALVGLQVLEHGWTGRAQQRMRSGVPSSALPALVLVVATNLVFSLIGVSAILSGHPWLMICGALLLAGALLSASVSTGTSTTVFVAGTAAAAASCFSILAVAHKSSASPGEQFAIALATVLLLFAVIVMRNVGAEALIALRAANESKGAFLANLSHEVRTPLNGILGVAQAMAVEDLPPAQRDRLEIITRSGFALLALLNDVLDLSKVEAGRLELELTAVDIGQLARDLGHTFAAGAATRGVRVEVEVASDAEGLWIADTIRIRQILTNLLSNAVKFTDRGAVRLQIVRCGHQLEIAVSDNGIGIADDQLERIFDKYAQASSSTASQYGGTGLGLAISRDLAKLMGGKLVAESALGAGSTFRLRLPLKRPPAVAEFAAGDEPPSLDLTGLRVLVAEDHEVNQVVVRLLLNQIGIEPHIVSDGEAAVEACRDAVWDLVLMDIELPGLDGPSAVRAIRALEAATGRQATSIIALSGNAMAHQVETYLASGMDDHVPKPLEFPRLIEAIMRVMVSRPVLFADPARLSA